MDDRAFPPALVAELEVILAPLRDGQVRNVTTVAREIIAHMAERPLIPPLVSADLVQRCKEILHWHSTGSLDGAALIAFAKEMPSATADDLDGSDLRRAETLTALELMRLIVLQPAESDRSGACS